MTSTHPVAFYLKELAGEPARRGGRRLALGEEGGAEAELQIEDAHARGVLEGRAAAQVEQDAALAKLQADFDKKLSAERQRWSREEGARIGKALETSLADLEARVAETVGQILKPLMQAEIRKKAVQELRGALADLLSQGDYAKITVSGPEDLLAAIEAGVGARHEGITFVAAETGDLIVRADDAIVETRIKAWATAIEGEAP